MTVIMPADYWAARKLTRAVAEMDGPAFIRFTRDAIPVIYDENTDLKLVKRTSYKTVKTLRLLPTAIRFALLLRRRKNLPKKISL